MKNPKKLQNYLQLVVFEIVQIQIKFNDTSNNYTNMMTNLPSRWWIKKVIWCWFKFIWAYNYCKWPGYAGNDLLK